MNTASDFRCKTCQSRRWIACCTTKCQSSSVMWCADCWRHASFERVTVEL